MFINCNKVKGHPKVHLMHVMETSTHIIPEDNGNNSSHNLCQENHNQEENILKKRDIYSCHEDFLNCMHYHACKVIPTDHPEHAWTLLASPTAAKEANNKDEGSYSSEDDSGCVPQRVIVVHTENLNVLGEAWVHLGPDTYPQDDGS